MALYYDFLISPPVPTHRDTKGKVENASIIFQRNFMARTRILPISQRQPAGLRNGCKRLPGCVSMALRTRRL